MNFFEQQEKARSNSFRFTFLFSLAVIATVVAVNFLALFILGNVFLKQNPNANLQDFIAQINWNHSILISLGTFVFIAVASLYKISELSVGGKAVALSLDCRLIDQNTKNADERKLLNIVEEIAIASSTTIPPVYLINSEAINAFAAGFKPQDAVIAVTRGAINSLNRDELQGIVAHEFSHIFNGDMRINIRLAALLSGIMAITILGYHIMRGSGRKNQTVFIGLGLIIIGSSGYLFGRLAQAAISRQREYLADSCAVQFTRNPKGILGALKKIGSLQAGSQIHDPKITGISHMLFAPSSGFFNTHPPLSARILAIDPSWNGDLKEVKMESDLNNVSNQNFSSTNNLSSFSEGLSENTSSTRRSMIPSIAATEMMECIKRTGVISSDSIAKAHDLIHEIPESLREKLHQTSSAIAVIYFLILQKTHESETHLELLEKNIDNEIYTEIKQLDSEFKTMDIKFILPVVTMAIPTLKQMERDQYIKFKNTLSNLIKSDNKTSIFEWLLQKSLINSLDAHHERVFAKDARYSLNEVKDEVAVFLSLMALSGNKDDNIAKKSFEQAAIDNNLTELSFIDRKTFNISRLDVAADKLEQLKPLEKEKLLNCCIACAKHDDKLSPAEVELIRGFSAILNCPLPLIA